ncbi:hypothetical protein Aph02nite_51420 [Actinoplanes philippinensis]|uniref:Uncharacterized protein n=1 Tax=Actinoplanes philippinensis TaxID=35752 RepID=A0A1I2INJ9_9ACTN|nr:hypothetical protein [Actinoplanes philippinensis]GIE79192.1 hypothetical protein Aph02nite_51420 [Actinoplanes philippinensis]SFF43270.1 hypothetical protein SAMN05421541_110215 [Actinoplanes philippinensis]
MAAKRDALVQGLAGVLVALLSALTWFAWLGWDDEYQTDPVTGVESGPYEAWQVAGCAVSLLILLVVVELAGARPLPASIGLTLGFVAAWTADAARSDTTGLFGVGALMLFLGLTIGSAMVSGLVVGLRDRRGPRPS